MQPRSRLGIARAFTAGLLAAAACDSPDDPTAPASQPTSPADQPLAAVVPTSGLIGEWKMDETSGSTANDSKNNYDATLSGQASFGAGKLGNALVLNNDQSGTGDDFATLPSNADLDPLQETSYSLSAWFFPETVPPDQSVTNRYYAIVAKAGQPMGIVYNGAQKFSMRHFLTGDVLQIAQGPTTYAPGQWYHVVGVVSKVTGEVKVFVNGVLQATTEFTDETAGRNYGTTRFQIGKAGTQWAADGKVDQVRIYDRVLTNTEVADLFAESSSPPPVARKLPVGVFTYNGIGNGPGNDASGEKWGTLFYPPIPSSIEAQIDQADQDSVLLILTMPGNKPAWETNNRYDSTKYNAALDRFTEEHGVVSDAVAIKIADAMARRRIVCYIIDEPNKTNSLGEHDISPRDVVQMAAEHKKRWPQCLTIARIAPSFLRDGWGGLSVPANGYPKLDYAWSQYNNLHANGGITPDAVWDDERPIANNLNLGLAVSLNLWAGGIVKPTDGQQPCWDHLNNGSSSGYVLGDREDGTLPADPRACSTLGPPFPSVIASPAWIRHFAQKVAADGGFPFLMLWNHATGTVSSEFNGYYTRSDFVNAFDDAIQTGEGAQAPNWRTPK